MKLAAPAVPAVLAVIMLILLAVLAILLLILLSINNLIISDATGRKFITILTTPTTPTTIPLGTSSIIKAEERIEKVGCDCVGIAEAPCRYSTP